MGGDIARDGNLHEYELELAKREFDSLGIPYHTVSGNMDVGNKRMNLSQGELTDAARECDAEFGTRAEWVAQFKNVFGPSEWSFEHKGVRFSGANTILAGSGLPEEAHFWDWMEAQRQTPPAAAHVWMFNYPLFIHSPDEPNWDGNNPEQYLPWYFGTDTPHRERIIDILKATNTQIVLSGHIHNQVTRNIGGIRYFYGPSTTGMGQFLELGPDSNLQPGFYRFDVDESSISGQFVGLTKESKLTGYGPGGT